MHYDFNCKYISCCETQRWAVFKCLRTGQAKHWDRTVVNGVKYKVQYNRLRTFIKSNL